jgi:putative ABC transport system substrate-binding protein
MTVRRREFVVGLGSAAAWPRVARAQQPDRMRRIGVLMSVAESDSEGQARIAAFREGLQKLGWMEGRNVRIEYRWAGSDVERRQAYAAELVGATPEVILASNNSTLAALQRATGTVPIVFTQVVDPVGEGFVASLARPGGNITGFGLYEFVIALKWLELLKEVAPRVTRVAVIYDPTVSSWTEFYREIEAGARSFGVQVSKYAVRDAAEIERAIQAFAVEPNGGLIPLPSPIALVHRELIIALAARHRLPNVYAYRYYPTSGGLASYGVNNLDLYQRAASYVDRILKGEKPGNLSIQFATKFELIINLKTAKALGLEVPVSLLARTDEVIE